MTQWSRFLDAIRHLSTQFEMPPRAIERTLFAVHEKYQEGRLYRS